MATLPSVQDKSSQAASMASSLLSTYGHTKETPAATLATAGNGDEIEIKDSKNLKSGKYSKAEIQKAIKAAKRVGVDPYQYLSLVLQESGFGTATVKTRRGKFTGGWAGVKGSDLSEKQHAEIDALAKELGLDRKYVEGAYFLKDKLNYGQHIAKKRGIKPDEDFLLQAFNGYGVLTRESFKGAKKAYGMEIPDKGFDMAKMRFYGKRLAQLKKDLMTNKEIASLLSN